MLNTAQKAKAQGMEKGRRRQVCRAQGGEARHSKACVVVGRHKVVEKEGRWQRVCGKTRGKAARQGGVGLHLAVCQQRMPVHHPISSHTMRSLPIIIITTTQRRDEYSS